MVERVEDLSMVDLPFPLIVKPSREDASVGIDFDSVVHDRHGLGRRRCSPVLQRFSQPALVERFIAGREIYVPLLGNRPRRALPLTEIRFGQAFEGQPRIVSYKAKWETESPECIDSPSVQAELDAVTEARLVKTAQAAFDALECRDYGRVDLRLSEDGEPYVIDINPNCDLHPSAGFAKSARAAGMDYRQLAHRLVEIALERQPWKSDRSPHRTGPRCPRFFTELSTFSPEEVSVALEVIDTSLQPGNADYQVLLAEREGETIGYICYGPTPMTEGTFDLYWIASDPKVRGQGVGAALVSAMEGDLRRKSARLVRIETSATEAYGPTRGFYEAMKYTEEARFRDFYKVGDDLIILKKKL